MISINRQLMSAGGQFPWRQLRRECISFNAAVKLLGFRLTRMSRGSAINCLTRPETAWWLVLASLEEMTTTNIQPDVISFDTALTSVSAAKRWKCGVQLWRRLGSATVEADVMLHSGFMSREATGGNWQRMVQRLQHMLCLGILPDDISYGNALSSCQAAENAWPVALALSLRRMAPRLLAPLLDACAVEVVWEEALAVLQGACDQHAAVDTFCYNALLNVLSKATQWQLALGLLHSMESQNLVSFNAALEACRLGRQWRGAVQLLQNLADYGLQGNVVSYGAAVNACERAMQWWPALQSLQRLQGIWPSTWDRTIQQLVPRMASQGQRGIPRGYTRTKFTCIYIYYMLI
ncbi:unnamed protein product [Cladocopium goreaui]|uniref:Pentacotripeptide-repeat region of PRORP domain-containing protein n=1 Tax=Cladocopium goreaui TaxID=2562237 RepID=A0A9P1C6V4_9DINO|nr:unnamed protein product [Cladocopium goreaui]